MRVLFASIGRLKAGAERQLFDRYAERIGKAGRPLGISSAQEIEIPEDRSPRAEERKTNEARALMKALPAGCIVIALDENGKTFTSEAFAARFESWKDSGAPAIALLVGGPDGHGDEVLNAADLKLAFGPMTWPHQIVRSLAAEQVYRAITILSGHPYHRA